MTLYYAKSTNGFYDNEINTVIPADAIEISTELHQSLMQFQSLGKIIQSDKEGNPVALDPPAPTKDQLIQMYESVAQKNLDSVAKAWGYSSIVDATSYANSTNSQYKAEAEALIAWRDTYWAKAYTIEESSLPNTVEDFIAALPAAPSKPTA